MSGGSFNYLCHMDIGEEWFTRYDDLGDMIIYLEENHCPELAQKIRNFKNELNNCERRITESFSKITDDLRTIEWVASGDYGNDVLQELEKS